jgi:hypothetical protein
MTTLLAFALMIIAVLVSYAVSIPIYHGDRNLPPLPMRILVGMIALTGVILVFILFYALAWSILN